MSLEVQIDIWRCFRILAGKKVAIITMALIAFLLACAFTSGEMKNVYSAQATIYITAEGGYNLAQAEATTNAMQRYAEVACSSKVLNRAAELISMENVTGKDLSDMITVSFRKDVSILYIKARSDSPALAVGAANAVSAAFVSEITAIVGQNTAQVLDVADDYDTERVGEVVRWLMRFLAAVLAVIFSGIVILLKDISSTNIKSPAHASLNGQLEVLGVIPNFPQNRNREGAQ